MKSYPKEYDVIVVGAGHAGVEAALSAARLGCRTLIITINCDTIALMPCNPAVGGPAKSQLVSEIDALGGQMGLTTDLTYLQMKMLNMAKGPAVRSLRAQSDKKLYNILMKKFVEEQLNLDVKQDTVEELIVNKNNEIEGVRTKMDVIYRAPAVVICTGTFLNGIVHIGLKHFEAGRAGEFSAKALSSSLKHVGLRLGRLKTGTTPRLDRRSIDFSKMLIQPGDEPPKHFSFLWQYRELGMDVPENPQAKYEQIPCHLTHTNLKTHKLILANLDRSPLYSGKISSVGPRYCPSIEDKVVRFKDKESHQVFIEPEGRFTTEMYTQGMNTSLPEDVQREMLRTMDGLENVEVIRPGYAIEYDYVPPSQLTRTLETRDIKGLFLAGQINGTSGYEEAASQGLVAGINAAMKAKHKDPLVLRRDDSYIGTLIDDLITKEIEEPYRMMTSRSEYRLLLRQDNADLRLTQKGRDVGLIDNNRYSFFEMKRKAINDITEKFKRTKISPSAENIKKIGVEINNTYLLSDLLKFPNIGFSNIAGLVQDAPGIPECVSDQVEVSLKYEGYIDRQYEQIEKFKDLEDKPIPQNIDYNSVKGISNEARHKLIKLKPSSVGQASRIAGVNPADISVLLIYMKANSCK
jgi:tRNA uridine 5-carboxymethylaminomethyl modification enzyme